MAGLAKRRAALVAVSASIATAVAGASWAAPLTPVPVKNDPVAVESDPASSGAWFGWSQHLPDYSDGENFFVQRGTKARIKVNAPGTLGVPGDINHRRGEVIYAQTVGNKLARLFSFNLRTKQRTPLPADVNQATWHDDRIWIFDVSAGGPWVLYSGENHGRCGPGCWGSSHYLVALYNRVTRRVQVLAARHQYGYYAAIGQVSGRFATWQTGDLEDEQGFLGSSGSTIVRRNLRTGKNFKIHAEVTDFSHRAILRNPAVSSDGTLYYWRTTRIAQDPTNYPYELIRQPFGGGTPEVIATLPTPGFSGIPDFTYVKHRPDGTNVIFYAYQHDIYKITDAVPAK